MSEQVIKDLQGKLEQATNHIKGLTAQVEASKAMFNESSIAGLNLRTNLQLFQQAHQELAQVNVSLQKQIETHKAQILVLANKVLELTPKTELHIVSNPEDIIPKPESTQSDVCAEG